MSIFGKEIGALSRGVERGTVKRVAAAVVVLIVAAYAGNAMYAKFSSVKRLAAARKADVESFSAQRDEYLAKRAAFDLKARKAFAGPPDASVVALVEEIAEKAGLKERITALKATGDEETLGFRVRGVELKIEKTDLNRLVNLLYMLEEGRRLFVINEFNMKSRFDDPELLDFRLKLSYLTKRPEER